MQPTVTDIFTVIQWRMATIAIHHSQIHHSQIHHSRFTMNLRRLLLWILIGSFGWLVISRFNEIENLALTLSQGVWLWVLVAALLQVGYQLSLAYIYQSAFATVGVTSRIRELLPIVMGALFINVVAPAGGTAGLALFVDDAVQRKHSPARVTAGSMLSLVAIYIGFLIVLLISLTYLFFRQNLKSYQVAGSILFCIGASVIVSLLFMGLKWPAGLRRLLVGLQNFVNGLARKFKRHPLLAENWGTKTSQELTESALAIWARPAGVARTISLSLLSHLIAITSLYTLFLAFRYPVPAGPIVAGYAIGYLFVIVSPTPQGLGIVEGVMPAVFINLGTPNAVATITILAYRGLTFWLPVFIGFLCLQRLKSLGSQERSLADVWSVRIVALLTGLTGLINVFSVVRTLVGVPALANNLVNELETVARYSPFGIREGGQLATLISGFFLLVTATALWRRKRTAWLVTLVILLISTVGHLLKQSYSAALLAGGVAVWLFLLHSHFHARSDRPSTRQGVQVLIIGVAFTLLYGMLGFYLLANQPGQPFNWPAALEQTITLMTRFSAPESLTSHNWLVGYFVLSIYLLSVVTLFYALIMLIRPVLVRQPANRHEWERAREIVGHYGRSWLGQLALLEDKSYYFSPAGSVIAFEVQGRTAIALGDPIGPPEDTGPAIAGFCRSCANNDWQPAFYQILPEHRPLYKAAGLDTVCIGQEGAIDLSQLNLTETATIIGHKATIIQPPHPNELIQQLQLISDEWLTMMGDTEKSFALGWFDPTMIRQTPVAIVYNDEGMIESFATIVIPPTHNEITIDLLRYRYHPAEATLRLLWLTLLQWASREGYATFNLGMRPLPAGDNDPNRGRISRYLSESVYQFSRFQQLAHLTEQFQPQWSPRYLAYPGTTSLPTVWTAILRATATTGYWWPTYRKIARENQS